MCRFTVFAVLLFGLNLGCSKSTQKPSNVPPAATPPPTTASEAKPLPPPPPEEDLPPSATVQQPLPPSNPSGPVSSPPPPGMVRVKAKVGVGAKGRYDLGVITTPAATYWAARERIMFTIQIPKCLEAYKFEHDFKGPPSHKEFMKEVVEKYHLQLPTLPPGHRYYYDPAEELLMIERPAP